MKSTVKLKYRIVTCGFRVWYFDTSDLSNQASSKIAKEDNRLRFFHNTITNKTITI